MAADLTVIYYSLLMLSGGLQKKKSHWRGRWSMTGRQLAAWSFVWGGLQAEFPSRLSVVSLHAEWGLCSPSLVRAALARALQRAVSFLISARWADNTVHGTQDSPPLRVFVVIVVLHRRKCTYAVFLKAYAGFLLLFLFCCYFCTGAELPRDSSVLRLIIKILLCYSSAILHFGAYKILMPL